MLGFNQPKCDEKNYNRDCEKNSDWKVTFDSLFLVFFV